MLRDPRKRQLRQEVLIRSNGTVMPDRLELSAAGIERAKASAKQIEQAKQQEALAGSAQPPAPPTQPTQGTPQEQPPSRPDAGAGDNVLELPKLPVRVPL